MPILGIKMTRNEISDSVKLGILKTLHDESKHYHTIDDETPLRFGQLVQRVMGLEDLSAEIERYNKGVQNLVFDRVNRGEKIDNFVRGLMNYLSLCVEYRREVALAA